MITNNVNFEKQTVIYDLGYSDLLAQIVYIKVRQTNTRSYGYKEKTVYIEHFRRIYVSPTGRVMGQGFVI